MDLPQQFPYKPRLSVILWNVGAGCAWIGLIGALAGHRPHGFILGFGLLPIALGLTTCLLRLVSDRYLHLGAHELQLPTGFLNLRTATIAYGTIECVWRVYLPLTAVLRIATKQGQFQIVSTMLPDNTSYLAVEKFLNARAQDKRGAKSSG